MSRARELYTRPSFKFLLESSEFRKLLKQSKCLSLYNPLTATANKTAESRLDLSQVTFLKQSNLSVSTHASARTLLTSQNISTNFFKLSHLTTISPIAETKETQSTVFQLEDDDQVFMQQVIRDIDRPALQNRFWENNPTMYLSCPTKFRYDANLYMTLKSDKVVSEVDGVGTILGRPAQRFSFEDLVRHLIPPLLNQESELLTKVDGNFFMRDINVTEKTVSRELFKSVVRRYMDGLNRILLFYNHKQSISLSVNTQRFLESNLLQSFCSLIDEYIAFQAVKLQSSASILEFIKTFESLLKEISSFVSLLDDYKALREKIGLFDYLILLRQNLLDNEFLSLFIDNSLKQSVLTVTRLIQNVAFKHAPLKLITDNLNIEYYKDEAYNYITKNIPKIFKCSIDKLLLINQNFLLLKGSDKAMHALILENKIELFMEVDKRHFAEQYDKIKLQLIELKDAAFRLITENMVG